MGRVLRPLLLADPGRCCCPVVSVGNIERIDTAGEGFGDPGDEIILINHPEGVPEAVLVHEIILGRPGNLGSDDRIDGLVVLVGEEDRLDVGILDPDMDHSVILLVPSGQFVLLDLARSVVVSVGAQHDTVLGAVAHGLGIDIVALLLLPVQPTILLPELEILHSLVIDPRVMVFEDRFEIDFRLGDVEE